MVSTPSENVKEVLKQLEAIVHMGYNPRNVFDDWLGLMLNALMRNEEEYLKIVRRYRNDRKQGEREIDYFCKAFGLLQYKMRETNRELMGEAYMQWEVSNKYTGQFFTPWDVASMMAQMTAPTGGSINDCCCGSGVMLIAACKTMTNEQLDKAVFVGQDIDITCVMMCALNFVFFNLNGYVIWGDSFKNERRRIFKTIRSYMGGSIVELDASAHQVEVPEPKTKEVMPIEKQTAPARAKKAKDQAALF